MNNTSSPSLTLIVTTYEWPEALDVVLASLSEQDDQDFEVIVADDGSGSETAAVVNSWSHCLPNRVEHIWQHDAGFRKARVENLAALEADGDLLVFLDGDLIPRRGFLTAVRRALRPGWFLTSKRLDLSQRLTRRVLERRLPVWRWSSFRWLLAHPRELVSSPHPVERNRPGLLFPIRDRRRPWRPDQPDFSPPYSAYCFFGFDRQDFERVNGFDARFVGWGEEDVDMGIRLRRAGLRCGWPGPDATLLHLCHAHRKATSSRNWPLLRETESSTRIEAVTGLRELADEREGPLSGS